MCMYTMQLYPVNKIGYVIIITLLDYELLVLYKVYTKLKIFAHDYFSLIVVEPYNSSKRGLTIWHLQYYTVYKIRAVYKHNTTI